MRALLAATAAAFALGAPSGPPRARAEPAEAFARAEGTRFVLDGRPAHVVGANVAVMHGREQRDQVEAILDAVARDGANVVRVWAVGEVEADAPAWTVDYAFRQGPRGFVEASLRHLDRVLDAARARDLRVIVVLANRWGDYGGVPAYLRWAGLEDPGRHPTPAELSAFWECAVCEADYQAHVRRVVGRVHAETGRPYAEDPTIFAWELMNEADAAGARGTAAMLAWMERQAALVRRLDPNHLVSAGHIGYERRRERRTWLEVCALEAIDYCDSHAYPLHDGRVKTRARLGAWVDDRVQLAHHVAGKPLLFGEVGVRTDLPDRFGRPSAGWLEDFFGRVARDGAAGALVWTYLPSEAVRRPHAVYAIGPRRRETRDVRAALRRVAGRLRARAPQAANPRLDPDGGDVLLFDPVRVVRGPGVVHRLWKHHDGVAALRIAPSGFERAAFEHAGWWAGDPGPAHFYGSGPGEVSFLVRRPPGRVGGLVVRLLASSELPGHGASVSAADGSRLEVALDGRPLGSVPLVPDDGEGRWAALHVPAVEWARAPVHRLTLRATDEGAGGVCLYDRAPDGTPAGIELLAAPTPAPAPMTLAAE